MLSSNDAYVVRIGCFAFINPNTGHRIHTADFAFINPALAFDLLATKVRIKFMWCESDATLMMWSWFLMGGDWTSLALLTWCESDATLMLRIKFITRHKTIQTMVRSFW